MNDLPDHHRGRPTLETGPYGTRGTALPRFPGPFSNGFGVRSCIVRFLTWHRFAAVSVRGVSRSGSRTPARGVRERCSPTGSCVRRVPGIAARAPGRANFDTDCEAGRIGECDLLHRPRQHRRETCQKPHEPLRCGAVVAGLQSRVLTSANATRETARNLWCAQHVDLTAAGAARSATGQPPDR
jgi:hypothetical protein